MSAWAARSACTRPFCPHVVPCPVHRADRRRPNATARGYDHKHRLWRAQILARDRICTLCGRAPSVVADHIVPLARGGDWSLENGRGTCQSCHSRRTARDSSGWGQ
jgi:5-methylcytosine-specific restriction enzyme A